MLVLGIESTCDETGVAVVEDGYRILSNCVLSQVPIHERFGGVVPELASRAHVEAITRMVERALREAGLERTGREGATGRPPIDLIAVANRPGLIGSLLVGVTAAKSLALAWDLPLVGVDHVHAHVYSATMRARAPFTRPDAASVFPAVSFVVSGGHTTLYSSTSWTEHRLLGTTQDDAVGEAFDKAAQILGLGYPGGPVISKAAEGGDPRNVSFPRTLLEPDSLDFSFSGIKTAVLYHAKGQDSRRGGPLKPGVRVADVAAAFEEAVVDVMVEKLKRAVRRQASEGEIRCALIAGGVAANRRLRSRLERFASDEAVRVLYPDLPLCTDNAAMIAGLGHALWVRGVRDGLGLDAHAAMAR